MAESNKKYTRIATDEPGKWGTHLHYVIKTGIITPNFDLATPSLD